MQRLKLFIALAAAVTLVGVLTLSLHAGNDGAEPASIQQAPQPSGLKETDRAMVNSAWYQVDLPRPNVAPELQKNQPTKSKSHIRLTSGEFVSGPGCTDCGTMALPMPAAQYGPAAPMELQAVYGAIPASAGQCGHCGYSGNAGSPCQKCNHLTEQLNRGIRLFKDNPDCDSECCLLYTSPSPRD